MDIEFGGDKAEQASLLLEAGFTFDQAMVAISQTTTLEEAFEFLVSTLFSDFQTFE
jgi:hypothetical protein